MKFCEKLLNLRKQNNMSQEQLADKLNVSRQAISKWESGSSVPDMEKMMQLCKFLNCNLEDLVDDGVGSNKKYNFDSKINWYTYYKEMIEFITKTLNMFWSMRFMEKVKCILEMCFLVFILFLVWSIIGKMLYSCFFSILNLLPDGIQYFLDSIFSFAYQIFGLLAGFVLLVHIFKIRYLDYFITIEDENVKEKNVELPIDENFIKDKDNSRRFIEYKKNKIIIRDPKHSTYNFFGVLARIVIFIIKIILVFVIIPCAICFVMLAFLAICTIFNISSGLFFGGIFLALVGALLINCFGLEMLYYFIFGLKYSFKKIFWLFMIGLLLIGSGIGVSFSIYLTFDKMGYNKVDMTNFNMEIYYEDNLILPFLNYENVDIIEENSIDNIKITIKHETYLQPNYNIETYYDTDVINDKNISTIYKFGNIYYQQDDFFEQINYFLKIIKDKKRLEINNENNRKIIVKVSKETLQKLKNNYDEYYD